jgi:hypothetical protein
MSANCTHMTVAQWNGFEGCWGCPFHGSQFSRPERFCRVPRSRIKPDIGLTSIFDGRSIAILRLKGCRQIANLTERTNGTGPFIFLAIVADVASLQEISDKAIDRMI